MAQSGYTPIQLYYSTTAAAVPVNTNLASGELALNIQDEKLYFKNAAGTVKLLASNATSAPVTSFQTSLSGLTPSTSTTGAVTLAGTLGTANGGTNLTSFTSGGLVYASSTSALTTGSTLLLTGTTLNVVGTNSAFNVDGGGVGGIGNTLGVVGTSYGYVGTSTATPLVFNTNSTERARISSGGDVSIGTTTAAGKLNVAGQITATTGIFKATGAPSLSAATAGEAILAPESGLGALLYGQGTTYDVTLGSRGTNVALAVLANTTNIYAAGNVLIGSTANANSAKLKSKVSAGGTGLEITDELTSDFLVVPGVSTSVCKIGPTSGAMAFQTANSEKMRLDTSGNLGIGTTSPTTKLYVRSTQAAAVVDTLQLSNNAADAGTGSRISFHTADAVFNAIDGVRIGGGSGGRLAFYTMGTGGSLAERVRITESGGFSVGTTADPGAGAIYATGNITAYYSDARLKTVSGKIENALDKVAQLSGVYYTNNSVAKSFGYDSDEVQVGVLAQDVEAVLPQIVKAAPFDLDENGNSKSGENYKTVQYERLVPLLIEAINELQAKVKALEAK